ncbi:MAG: hypothetical protein GPJ52_13480, partial [Candidatus Heimdallarchaeota archaeon]|nr:hypothetical protein [Candidatus Heimdallarchaeota archaeon]
EAALGSRIGLIGKPISAAKIVLAGVNSDDLVLEPNERFRNKQKI